MTRTQQRALIVDDEPVSCELVRSILKANGIEAITIEKSAAAAAYLWTEKFSVVLLDLQMSSPDGIELARRIRGSGVNQQSPIVMLSDDDNPAVLSEAFEAGANFFLYKPIDEAQLVKVIGVTQGVIEHERRRFRRVPLRSKVSLAWGDLVVDGETIDVSLNGLLVKADCVGPLGIPAQMNLYLSPGTRPIVGSCSVKRIVGKNQMGIELNQLSTSENKRLEQFLLPITRHEWAAPQML